MLTAINCGCMVESCKVRDASSTRATYFMLQRRIPPDIMCRWARTCRADEKTLHNNCIVYRIKSTNVIHLNISTQFELSMCGWIMALSNSRSFLSAYNSYRTCAYNYIYYQHIASCYYMMCLLSLGHGLLDPNYTSNI